MAEVPTGRGRARSRTLTGDDVLDLPDLDGTSGGSSGASSSSSGSSGSSAPSSGSGTASPAARTVSSQTQKALTAGLHASTAHLPSKGRFTDDPTDEELMEEELLELERMDQARKEASTAQGAASSGRKKDGRIAATDASAPKYDMIIKLLLLGDSGVGKTSLLQRYAKRKFDSKVLASAGVAYETQYVKVEGRVIRVDIWDTAGQERFHVITQAYYAGAQGIILAYDASDASETSFNNIRYWMSAIGKHASKTCKKVLLGNKVDVPSKAISTERGSAVAEEFDVKFFETSAKTGANVDAAFQTLARDCVVQALEAEGTTMSAHDSDGAGGKRCVVC